MYWEKTVEYCFLASCLERKLVDFASPLSGKQERGAGDAIFGQNAKLLLVEFKSKESEMKKEEAKFDDFAMAKNLLSNRDGHHFFVYGEKDDHLILKAVNYFSRNVVGLHDYSRLPTGLDGRNFNSYLVEFLALRKRDERGDGKTGISDFSNVLGLNGKGAIVQVCTLAEYAAEVFPSLVNKTKIAGVGPESEAMENKGEELSLELKTKRPRM